MSADGNTLEDRCDAVLPETSLTDVLLEIRRIADVIAPRPRVTTRDVCGEWHEDNWCVLGPFHRGPHASGDGATRWVDD